MHETEPASTSDDALIAQHNIDVLSAISRTLSDGGAYDDLLRAIDARLDVEQVVATRTRGTNTLPRLLGPLEKLLALAARRRSSVVEDDVYDIVEGAALPAALIMPDGRLIHANSPWEGHPALAQAAMHIAETLAADMGRDAARAEDAARLVTLEQPEFACFHVLPAADLEGRRIFAVRMVGIEIDAGHSDLFSEIWNLTASEFAVLQGLVRGQSRDAIAAERGSSPDTVKRQTANLLKKAGVHSQAECIRVAHLVVAARSTGAVSAESWHDPWHHEQTITRPGGETLTWSWTGDPAGRPCLIIHGPDIGYALTPQWHRFLRTRGLKMYAVQRPGYGHSTIGAAEDVFAASCDAIAHFTAAISGPPDFSIGLHNGALPLLRLRAEGRLGSGPVFAYSDILPMTGDRMAQQPVAVRAWFRMARTAPSLLRLTARTGMHMIRKHGAIWYLTRSFSHCDADRAALADDTIVSALDNSVRMMIAQDVDAFVRELELLDIDPAAWLDPQSSVWIAGEHDPSVDREQRRALDASGAVTVADIAAAGQLAFFTHAEEFQSIIAAKMGFDR